MSADRSENRNLGSLAWTTVKLLLILLSPSLSFAAPRSVSFNRDVRPILSDRCFHCHGPDAENQESSLRLDSQELATADLGGYAGIVPGDLEASELHHRIRSHDDGQMPPPDSNRQLSDREKDILDAWILAGAKYEEHWAFENLPAATRVPKVSDATWPHQPLDRFVLAALDREKLTPTAEAAPTRWLRRATFDLTGLPPSQAEINAFLVAVKEDREKAYESTVSRLLASDSFGEHFAVAWLDAARYADSYGYQSDKLNTQWPYRDWVVRAFNDNLPFDEFLTFQLAGDLIENASSDQRLATAFNRIHRLNNEGGAIFEEWRLENVADRVHTFGTAILGLTLECCRCHDHKYDPLTTRDYYSLSAFFNSIDENGLYDRTQKVPSPSMLLPTNAQREALETAKQEYEVAKREYQSSRENLEPRWQDWRSQSGNGTRPIPDLLAQFDFDESPSKETNKKYFYSTGDRGHCAPLAMLPVENTPIPAMQPSRPTRLALELDGERGVTVKGIEPFDRWTPFSVVITLREQQRTPSRSVIAHHTRGTDAGYNGWDLTIEDGYLESRLYRVWPGNAIGVRTQSPIPADQWHQIAATYDGSSTAAGLKLYLNGKSLGVSILRDSIVKSANVKVDHGGEFVMGQRFRDRGLARGLIDDLRIYQRALTPVELMHLATGKPLEITRDYFASAIDAATRTLHQELLDAQKSIVMAAEVMQEVPIMAELSEPRETHILERGVYDAPTSDQTLVSRDTFERVLPKFQPDLPRDRMGLAKWVTEPSHPLTARVIVNRLWSNFFGAGLVRTPENFGVQGELPTHPELLDWLARDLVENAWDMKRFCRNIVLSATYRQDSSASAELMSRDPDNRLLARGPAYRLSAEQIRDMALATSGLLNRKQGGPPVSPYQAGGDLWKESNSMSPAYQQSVGTDLYRRSLYSVWKRTAPLPNMMAFDSTSREVCTVKRSRTNTPLQALVLLNDVQFIEAARALASKLLGTADEGQRISDAFTAFTGRIPDQRELDLLLELYSEERDHYESNPEEAEELLRVGDSKADLVVSRSELAAMTVVCQAILNLDATIWRR